MQDAHNYPASMMSRSMYQFTPEILEFKNQNGKLMVLYDVGESPDRRSPRANVPRACLAAPFRVFKIGDPSAVEAVDLLSPRMTDAEDARKGAAAYRVACDRA